MTRKLVYLHHLFFIFVFLLISLNYKNTIIAYKTQHPSSVVREHLFLEEEGIITGISLEDHTIHIKTADGVRRILTDVPEDDLEQMLMGNIEGAIARDTYDYQWRSPKNSYMFDYDKYLYANNIEGRFTYGGFSPHPVEEFSKIEKGLYHLRTMLYRFTYKLPSTKTRDMLMAILWHETEALGSYDTYALLGIAHLFTLSGLHFGLIYMVLRKCFFIGPYWQRKVAICILLVFCYGVLGSGYASLRALLMILYIEIASLVKRQPDRLTLICSSNIVLLCIYPRAILSTGYQLSFYAYTVIAYVMPIIMASKRLKSITQKSLAEKETLRNKILKVLTYYIILQILLMPITLYYFKQYNVWSFLVNLIFIPIFSIMVPALLFWCIAYAIYAPLAVLLLPIFEKLFLALSFAIDHMPLWSIAAPLFKRMDLYIMVLLLLCFTFFKAGIKWRTKANDLFKILMTLGMVCLLASELVAIYYQPLKITSFDVGHGDATLITYHHRAILVDTGSSYAHLSDILKAQGVNSLDYVILSHSHEDHIGGFIEIQKNIPIEKVICLSDVKDVLLSNGAQEFEVTMPTYFKFDDLVITPGLHRDDNDPNDNGVWVGIKLGAFEGALFHVILIG